MHLPKKYLNHHIIWCADTSLSVISTIISFLSFHFLIDLEIDNQTFLYTVLVSLFASVSFTRLCKTYEGIIRHTTVSELTRIIYAMLLKTALLIVLANIFFEYCGRFIYAIIFFDLFFSVALLMSMRVFVSYFYYQVISFNQKNKQRTLIYGTSEAAVSLAVYLRNKEKNNPYQQIGFISHRKQENNYRICGLPIFYVDRANGYRECLEANQIKCILFASTKELHENKELINFCIENHINLQIAPLLAIDKNNQNIQLHDVQIEDLLERDEITIDTQHIHRNISGLTVMVTGAAGSISSEICRQLCQFDLKNLVLFDFSETATYQIDMELRNNYPGIPIVAVIGDVRDPYRIESTMQNYRPDIIFHAAAYKHVPMMEEYPCEAIRTNVGGTVNMADLAVKYEVRKFIMVSTDKAVNPSNVMGATKRLAEMYVQSLGNALKGDKKKNKTSFITTRFGNVLGSNGSVIPLFREQIQKGGPVTVTHPDVVRYFMTIPEACRLVLEAGFLGEGNDIYLFDMGEAIKIDDMACRMIQLAGLQPGKDIEIKYVGLRPGEKLFEETLYLKEQTIPTNNPKIFKAICIKQDYTYIKSSVDQLMNTARTDDKIETVRILKQIVSDFKSQHSIYETLDKKMELNHAI